MAQNHRDHGEREGRYLVRIVASYMNDREIVMEAPEGTVSRMISFGVSQSSVLGLTLGNLKFNDILKIARPSGVKLICYADDTLVMYCGETVAEMATKLCL